MQRVLLLGYFGAGNFGDDALLVDWLSRHREWLGQQQLAVDVTSSGADPLAGFIEGGQLRPLIGALVPKAEVLKLDPRRYHALIAPGGSLLQDVTSLRSLLYYLWAIRRFTRAGVPVYLLNQGLGPIISWTGRLFTPRVLRGARLLSLRDEQSYTWARTRRALARHAELHLACDPVLSAALAAYPAMAQPEALSGLERGYLLVLPRATGDLPTPRESITEAQALAKLLAHARVTTGLAPVLYAMHHGRDDAFCDEVRQASGGECGVLRFDDAEAFPASALWQVLGQAGLVLSYRLHGLVCAAAHGVPAMGVAYDPKVSAFCEAIGYPWCFPANVHTESALVGLEQLWTQRESVIAAAAKARREMLDRLAALERRFHELW
jgi:polysaccharide pyruvyl transferase CsaB